ncbi:Protein SUPPRESSOR OF QUENCHING 1 [Phytophthora citrophthora]|uniref:Protein SUPPRESSOR OF QUENCHING 1 n=1 Tax=Phytophthora citrophthora TaxID=4793 RepID=A0AAD9H1A5_9STRA|nr:Protein SUPPRESSOR OF QUENCHING 1 [Phytophthora citrophthora]
MTRYVGNGRRGHLDGDARKAELNQPFGVCTLRDGTLAFTDSHNNAVRFVVAQPSGRYCVKTVECSSLLSPKGIAASSDDRHLFVCDTGHHKIKLAALPGRSVLADTGSFVDGVNIFNFAGNGKKGWHDGPALEASFNSPAGVCEYIDGSIVVADTGNHCIRQIRRGSNGKLVVKTIAGAYASLDVKRGRIQVSERAANTSTGKQISGYRDGVRSLFRSPSAVISTRDGELLVADTMNNCIRCLEPPTDGDSPWKASTICGQMRPGHADGSCEAALFDQPVSLCWNENCSSIFVADRGNECIRQIGRSQDHCYSWVRTIEVEGIPQALRSVRRQELYQSCRPLGIVCIPLHYDEVADHNLVICDGGDNMIKLLPLRELEHHVLDVRERFLDPKLSDHSTFSQSGSDSRSYLGSLSYVARCSRPVTLYPDSEGLSENQFGDGGGCCEASRALAEALKANAVLQIENMRLRELLQRTFDEIELADKRFTENYQPQID